MIFISLPTIALYSLAPAFGMILGGAIASVYQPSNKLTSATQHFAAGVVFAAVAKELLPKLGAENEPIALITGFSLGVISMLLLKQFSNRLMENEGQRKGVSLGLVSAVGVDLFIDGILIGVSFLAGARGGILIAIALAMEILFLGLSTTATLGSRSVGIKTRLLPKLVPCFTDSHRQYRWSRFIITITHYYYRWFPGFWCGSLALSGNRRIVNRSP